jgi:hypothetical protein
MSHDPDNNALPAAPPEELAYFSFSHLREPMRSISLHFSNLAYQAYNSLPDCRQRAMCLEHLLIAKDAAVRAALKGLKR